MFGEKQRRKSEVLNSIQVSLNIACYLRRRLASEEGSVTLDVTLTCYVCVRHISLGGEGNALYPVLSSYF